MRSFACAQDDNANGAVNAANNRGYSYGLGAAGGFAGGSDGEFGAGGAVGKTLSVGGTVALAGEPNLDGVTTDGVSAFADFKNVRSNWLASIAA